MEAAERDTTDEWRIAPERAPATVAELEGRIDVALATARSAEEAALEIGAASPATDTTTVRQPFDPFEERINAFRERTQRVMVRLRMLETLETV